MKIAVLMTTYNGERYLKAQIESILNQKVNVDIDLIVRDDGSRDGTVQILEDYTRKGKLRYFAGSNLGAAKGFITLVKENPGYDFYAFSDQDDVWHEDKLQKGIDAIAQYNVPALYASNATLVHSDLKAIGRDVHRKEQTFNLISVLCMVSSAQGCTSVFNKQLAKIVQDHDIPETFVMHDTLLTCLCALVDGKLIYDHESSMLYRMHNTNVYGVMTAKQGMWHVIRSRFAEITKKEKIGMYIQTRNLLDTYYELINEENRKLCRTVIASEKSFVARLKLVFDKNLKHGTLNKLISIKLKILFGNG